MEQIDVQAIKERVDIVSLIASDLGDPVQSSGRWQLWRCPFHPDENASLGATTDTGTYYCFGCGATGDAIAWVQKRHNLPFMDACERLGANQQDSPIVLKPEEDRLLDLQERHRLALDLMTAQEDKVALYHYNMPNRDYWYSQGLTDETIDKFQLGFAPRCPTYQKSPSHTIPVFYNGRLFNIRHRLALPPTPGDKYRPHMAGLPAAMFNADACRDNPLLMIVEGEVKAMVLTQYGFPAVGIPGANTFKPRWAKFFNHAQEVFVAFDPGAEEKAVGVCELLGQKAKLVRLPVKPDDFFVIYRGTFSDLDSFLRQPIPIDKARKMWYGGR